MPTGPLTGRTLGDFVVGEQIGEGGIGAVYRAEQALLGRLAVIKVPRIAGDHSEYSARFLREARLASALDHPYAAHIYAFGVEPDGTLWTAMELVRGTPMDQLIAEHGPLAVERFVPLFERLCEVVHSAHEQGIIHRDIKPSNVMVISRAGRLLPKLLDLGIAKGEPSGADDTLTGDAPHPTAHDDLIRSASLVRTQAGRLLGSPAYMAPEQWSDARKVDARTDVYSLGVFAYEALTGHLPFRALTTPAMARAHARDAVPSLAGAWADKLDPVLARAMAKRPKDRFATPLELGAALATASGLARVTEVVVTLPRELRDQLMANAPQPIAEAVAVLDTVRNPLQAVTSLYYLARVIVRLVGNLALAAWSQRDPSDTNHPGLVRQLGDLHNHGLADEQWIALVRTIAEQSVGMREAFAIPELIDTFAVDSDTRRALATLIALKARFEEAVVDEAAIGSQLTTIVALVATVLDGLAWLTSYQIVRMVSDSTAEVWSGTRRNPRRLLELRRAVPASGGVALVGGDATPVAALAPYVQIAEPTPGMDAELFVLDGGHRGIARLISLPRGFERSDPELWGWVRTRIAIATDERAARELESAPYLGLAAFTRKDAERFVGRERETEEVANRLRVTAMLAIAGPSGAGKSSFVQAGVVPTLGPSWRSVIVRPGALAVSGLLAAIRQLEGIGEVTLDNFREAIHRWLAPRKQQLLIYVDQFEELFTLTTDNDERDRYVAALLDAARDPDDPIRVVITVRDDFLLRCQQLEALRDRLVFGLQLLATPTRGDLERILIEPARRVGYEFEELAMAREMVDAIADQPAALPLLSFTASQLWELRDRQARVLPRKAYESLGGVGGGLAQHAERVLASLPVESQALVRVVFRNLVTADGTRAILSRAETLAVLGNAPGAERVVESLINARLVTASEGADDHDRIEVAHEALLSAWPRLIEWRREDAEGARMRDQLRSAARQWHERGRPSGLLWRDEALAEYRLWRARFGGYQTDVERDFGHASERAAARGRRIRTAAVMAIFASLAIGLVVALTLFRRAEREREHANEKEREAVVSEGKARELAVTGYLTAGQRAALAGDRLTALVYLNAAREGGVDDIGLAIPLAVVRNALNAEQAVFHNHQGKVWGLELLADGRRFVTGGADGVVNIWALDRSQPLATIRDAKDGIFSLTVSRDGRLLAVPSFDGHVRVYDLATYLRIADFDHAIGPVYWALFTPDSSRVIAQSLRGTASVWRLDGTLAARMTLSQEGNGPPAVSPDGKTYAAPSFNATIGLWNIASGKLERTLAGVHTAAAWAAAYSPDGKLLAIASYDNTVSLWDAASGRHLHTLVGHAAGVDVVEWSADGSRLASGGRDGAVRIWNRDGQLERTLASDRGLVFGLAWSRDGHRVMVASGDTATVWDRAAALAIARLQGQGSTMFRVIPIGGTDDLLAAGSDGTVRRYHSRTELSYALAEPGPPWNRLVRCRSGSTPHATLSWLVSGSGRARQVATDGKLLWQSPPSSAVSDAGCTASGTVVVALADGTIERIDGAQPPVVLPLPKRANPMIAVAPIGDRVAIDSAEGIVIATLDGKTVATSGKVSFAWSDTGLLMWDPTATVVARVTEPGGAVWSASGKLLYEIAPPGGTLRNVVFDDDQRTMYVIGQSYHVVRRVVATGEQVSEFTSQAYPWTVRRIADRVYVGLDDGSLAAYDATTAALVAIVGQFGSDIVQLEVASERLMWVMTTGKVVSLVDVASRAVLFQARLPSDPWLAMVGGARELAVFHLDGTPAMIRIATDVGTPARLRDELACRAPVELRGGQLVPRSLDEAACGRLK